MDEEQLFGDYEPKVYSAQGRGFTSKDRTIVTAYIPNFHKHCSHNNVFKTARKLVEGGKRNDALAEQLDNEISRACQHGDNMETTHAGKDDLNTGALNYMKQDDDRQSGASSSHDRNEN